MVWRRSGIIALVLGLWAVAGGAARADDPARPIVVQVRVSHALPTPGPIDDEDLDRHLRSQFKYQSLRQLQSERLRLSMNEIGSVRMPNGREIRLRPLSLAGSQLLMAVDVEAGPKMDLKMESGRLVVVGGQPYKGGTLIIVLDPSF